MSDKPAAPPRDDVKPDAEAAGHYAEFAERFADDDRAKAAKKKVKKLR